jgi:hypothetical protein
MNQSDDFEVLEPGASSMEEDVWQSSSTIKVYGPSVRYQ